MHLELEKDDLEDELEECERDSKDYKNCKDKVSKAE